jgi:hypothetical protein
MWNIIALWKVESKRVETKITDELSVVGIWRDETKTTVEADGSVGAWSREHQVPCRKDNICRICVPFLSRISRRSCMSSSSSWTSNTRSYRIARLSGSVVDAQVVDAQVVAPELNSEVNLVGRRRKVVRKRPSPREKPSEFPRRSNQLT